MVEPPELRGPTREQVLRRRLAALLVLVGGIAVAVWAVAAAVRSDGEPAPPPTTVAPLKEIALTFPEGWTRREMAARTAEKSKAITAQAYLAATRLSALPAQLAGDGRRRSLEGFLFPDTYLIFDTGPATRLVDKQVRTFQKKWAKVDLRYARSKNLTQYDVLIIASMIEKEVVVPRERRLVAAVIYNRLRARMPLAIDATLRYGLGIPPTQPITKRDLASDSAYNTRRFRGLPPTPIANPGLASMQAAAHPAQVGYLYFVRKPDCRSHFFTASLEAFDNYTRKGLTDC